MTVLAKTKTHIAEYERGHGGLLTIARSDGKCLGLTGKGIADQFRDCIRTSGADKTIDCFIRLALYSGSDWRPLYKKSAMPNILT